MISTCPTTQLVYALEDVLVRDGSSRHDALLDVAQVILLTGAIIEAEHGLVLDHPQLV